MDKTSTKSERPLYLLLGAILGGSFLAGAVSGGATAFQGLWFLQYQPARLLHDFTLLASPEAALLNASLVAALALLIIWRSKISMSGPTVAAVLTVFGFGLFGKTPLNVVPILLGVALSARLVGKSFGEYIIIALFGTALGPLTSVIAVELGLTGVAAVVGAALGGLVAGVLLPPVAIAMLRLHQGYNLYNMGLTTGFLALFGASLLRASGSPLEAGRIWNQAPPPLLIWLVPAVSVLCILLSVLLNRTTLLSELKRIISMPGRLPSDFISTVSSSAALLNMGIMGLLSWGYVIAVGGPLNGPVLGGIFTIIGFAAFGKHPRNALPIMAGVVLASLLFGHPLDAPGPLLAVLFGTTLAPLAGDFGIPLGVLAGFIHLVMVMQTGGWHGGISLYNNGFAGGLTAALLVAIIEWRRTNKRQEPTFRSRQS